MIMAFCVFSETGGFENRIDIDNGYCVVLLRTRSNRLVLGTTAGIYFFDDKKRRFEKTGISIISYIVFARMTAETFG